ncbi:MAG TPA: shikimate dehydrogenase [Nocardioides sp.]|uniref:shikimate dehydrogenase n=1 Tax=uncultured Nocardioides sp. TaxID=198441 RepID=UPI000EE2A5D2|nr:shikimate dehydrogenase [uncultured Nocardioides sp.]HCB06584.1 shikimate dehydrogenase [Nocardioides sp.]HRD62299.1 shikimate dehydrogenase [Nocardioides sp.]HRI98601.1 shikimate dehydrogenase [Nocardioides sp.]HRK48250.1 shikimate dehydrogenase [Nocardioides sp.]
MRCAVLGDPIDHSLSPAIHRAAYRALGLDGWSYDPVRVHSGGLAAFLDGLDPTQWRGLSLTAPLKREVVPMLSSYDEWVAATGGCNTVLLEPDGGRHGLNTDVTGALMVLGEYDGPLDRAVVLGGGATATSLLLALAERGMSQATLVVRDPARATETVQAVAAHRSAPRAEVVELAGITELTGDVVVSTVPATAQVTKLIDAVADIPLVFEVVYSPWPTPLAAAAAASGRTVFNGLDLLVAQAVNQVVAMTGRYDVPAGAMRRAAEEELAAREVR